VDEIDIANEQAELFLASALANQRKAAARAVEPPGECLNCGADLYTSTRRFCDSDCAEDWQHRNRVRQKQGSQP
jgi:predicted nucleic acid-binding Zn ribbon protein